MPGYETLDAIADTYNPLLAAIALLLVVLHLFRKEWQGAAIALLGFAAVALVAYGVMFLDRSLGIWPAFGLDYSTHTAEALGLVLLLSLEQRKLTALWSASLLIYFMLMLYQRYHTLADIVTTAITVITLLSLVLAALYRRHCVTAP